MVTKRATPQRRLLAPGTRVRIRGRMSALTLSADTGTIVRPDEYCDYYIVRLDAPAIYDHGVGEPEVLHEICEDRDNMVLLRPAPRPRDGNVAPRQRRT